MARTALRRLLVILAAAGAITGLALASSAAQAPPTPAPGAEITTGGVGGVQLGGGYKALRRQGLLGKIRKGCELAPNTRSAPLSGGVTGSVNFTRSPPRRVTDISIRGGASANGVGFGATLAQIQTAFPTAQVDHGTDRVFRLTMVNVPNSRRPQIQFALDVDTGLVTLIGVPFIAFCE